MQTNLERVALLKDRAINALRPNTRLSGALDQLFSEAESEARTMDENLFRLEVNINQIETVGEVEAANYG